MLPSSLEDRVRPSDRASFRFLRDSKRNERLSTPDDAMSCSSTLVPATTKTHATMESIKQQVVEVSVIVPVHNAAATIVATVESAMYQVDISALSLISIHVCCYDDGSTDDSWKLLTELKERNWYNENKKRPNNLTPRIIPTSLEIAKSPDGVGRGAGYARNRAVGMRAKLVGCKSSRFLCWLDSDDVMHPTRVGEQVAVLLSLPETVRERTLVGCTFDRDPPDATWHYAQWANGLSDERLVLEKFRELTLLQPTWMLSRLRFEELGGYIEAPPPDATLTMDAFLANKKQTSPELLNLVHPTFDTLASLRVAEDLRFFHEHLLADGLLKLHRTNPPLLTYRHRANQSQSSQTPRKLLLYLRVLAFETAVLKKDPVWQQHNGAFVIWGSGRDGKDFVKALSSDMRQRIYCMVDVDEKKIDAGYYMNRQIDCKIPVVHFSLLAADPAIRQKLQSSFEDGIDINEPGYGHISKGKPATAVVRVGPTTGDSKGDAPPPQPPRKKRKLHAVAPGALDLNLLPRLPVVVCVAMYRTSGALEHNVKMIGRSEGKDLWHFS